MANVRHRASLGAKRPLGEFSLFLISVQSRWSRNRDTRTLHPYCMCTPPRSHLPDMISTMSRVVGNRRRTFCLLLLTATLRMSPCNQRLLSVSRSFRSVRAMPDFGIYSRLGDLPQFWYLVCRLSSPCNKRILELRCNNVYCAMFSRELSLECRTIDRHFATQFFSLKTKHTASVRCVCSSGGRIYQYSFTLCLEQC